MTKPEQLRQAWDKFAEGYDTEVTPFSMTIAEDALDRVGIRPGMRFLDVAAGGGALSIPAARLGAEVLATDISPVMMDRLQARARAEGLSNLEAEVMDGHALELEDDSFDVSGSQLGIMLFPERQRALAELARVTRPGGRTLMVVFGPLERVEAFDHIFRALSAAVPDFEPPAQSPLFSLQDPEQLRQEMSESGFKGVQVDTVDYDLEVHSADRLWRRMTSSTPPIGAVAESMSEQEVSAAQEALDRALQARPGGLPASLNMQVNIAVGTKE